jgi:hypothetical protein
MVRRLPNLLARFQGSGVNDVPGIGLAPGRFFFERIFADPA